MKRIISTIFILIGIVFISLPYASKRIIKEKVKTNQNILEEITIEEIEENETTEAEYDYSSVRDVEARSVITKVNHSYNKSIIGQIIIPDLDMNLPILKGTNDANLMAGATTMIEDQQMGEKNYPLAGHYMKDESLLFGSLIHIEEGSIVKITNKKMTYEYRIYHTLLVPETSIYMLEHEQAKERGKPIISLMTCYYTSKNQQRFFALGELIDEYPNNGRLDIRVLRK